MAETENTPKAVKGQAVLPIVVSELERLEIDTTGIPDGTTYAAIFSSPFDLKRGVKRWIDAGLPDPFTYSTSYSHLYNECVKLKDGHEEVSKNLVEVCKERENLRSQVNDLENEKDKLALDITELSNNNNLSDYRIQALNKKIDDLEQEGLDLEAQVKEISESLLAERAEKISKSEKIDAQENSIAYLDKRIFELKQQISERDDSHNQMRNKLESTIRERDAAENRLGATAWRRFISTMFLPPP